MRPSAKLPISPVMRFVSVHCGNGRGFGAGAATGAGIGAGAANTRGIAARKV